MPASKYTPEQRAQALKLYETQGPTAAGHTLGIPKETIMSWAKRAGVHTVRTDVTRAAVEAKVVDGKLRRANIADRMYGQAETILDSLESGEFKTLVKGQGGADHEDTLDFVPPNDRKTLIQAVGTAMVTTARLEAVDAGHDTSATDSVIDSLLAGFRSQHANSVAPAPVGDEGR